MNGITISVFSMFKAFLDESSDVRVIQVVKSQFLFRMKKKNIQLVCKKSSE